MSEKPTYEELEQRIQELEIAESKLKRTVEYLNKRIVSLTMPIDDAERIGFENLFNLDDIQRLQDEFAGATGVASIITHTDGTPITKPSNFCQLCSEIIRKTDKGLINCYKSDAVLGRLSHEGPIIQQCMSGGLWDAGAGISIGGQHIANWLIGQVRDASQTEEKMRAYARGIGTDETAMIEAFRKVPSMSRDRFEQVAQVLFTLANQLSAAAYQNVQQARFITERKQVEEALRESELFFSQMFEQSSTSMCLYNPDGTINKVNAEFCEMFGVEEKLIKESGYNVFKDQAAINAGLAPLLREIFDGKKTKTWEFNFDIDVASDSTGAPTSKTGKLFLEVFGYPVLNNHGNLEYVVLQHYDVTERKQAGEALIESEEKYRRIYNNILDVYYEASIDGIILEISPSIEKMSKYKREELIGKSLYQLYTNPEERDRLVEVIIRNGRVSEYELYLTDKDGTQRICSLNAMLVKDDKGEPHKLVGILRNISERKRAEKEKEELEERLVRSQKMESLGLLAGGVAHDLNNVLSGIVSYPDLLLMDLPEGSPLIKPILTIQNSGQRAADIVQDLLTLARRGVSTTKVLNINEIILDYLKSPEYLKLLKDYPTLSVETNLENELLNIKGSPIHLKKAIMNLVSNAAEAQSSCGKIIISTNNKYIDTPIKEYEEIREGDFVVLEVADNGTGIAVEDLSRIFEPFYTKKVMGRSGTGLGMAVVWGSVQDHNGYINVESTEGEGATFYLYFPVIREEITKNENSISIEDYMGNNESILVIDDIKEQREIATSILSRLNYSVSAVSSGEAAIEYMQTNTADLLVLDMIMVPGIDGLETFKKILEYHPRQKAVIASGFSETDRVKKAQRLGVGQYIKKPYTLEKIGIAVKEELKK